MTQPARLAPLDLPAEPRERGRAHGEAERERIHEHAARWADETRREGREPEAARRRIRRDTGFHRAVRRFAPGLLDEVVGIAEGADLAPDLVFALQLLDERWWLLEEGRRRSAAPGCSVVAVPGRGGAPTRLAQNMDLPAWCDGLQHLQRIAAERDRPARLVFGLAGLVGLCGVNAAGTAIAVNALLDEPASREGLPVAFVLRSALDRSSASEACAHLAGLPHASGQAYTVADPEGVRVLEAAADGVVELAPQDPLSPRLHTNHALAPERCRPGSRPPGSSSVARLEALRRHLGTGPGSGASEEAVQQALACRRDPRFPVSRSERRSDHGDPLAYTVGSVRFDLGEPPRLWWAPGPPSEWPYREVRFPGEPEAPQGSQGAARRGS